MFMVALTTLKLLSILAFLILVVGVLFRRDRRIHIPLMLTAIIIDLSIVAYIEITRDALAAAKAKMGTLMIVHIALSVSVLILYAVQVVTGIRNVRGGKSHAHRKTMPWLVAARLGNLITSFLVS